MPTLSTLARAIATFTSATILNAETVTVNGKVYTFQTTLTDVDGNVNIGADAAGSASNLLAAINLSNAGESAVGAGTDYAASMTKHVDVYATRVTTVVTFVSNVPGTIGNRLALAETSAGSISGALFTGGAGSMATAIEEIRDGGQVNADVLNALDQIDGSALGESPV